MYFQNFPIAYYSLYDDLSNVKVVTNITARVKLSDEVKNNLSLFDEYDIKDGDTPEIVADKFYNNPQLHWIILHTNDILDARFDWPLTTENLKKYCEGKYTNIDAVHHYEDTSGNQINGNAYIHSSSNFANIFAGNVIVNLSNNGIGVVTQKISSSNVRVLISDGGFVNGDVIAEASNTIANVAVTSVVTISGLPVTNYNYEDSVNETKRRIRILKSRYVDSIIRDFKKQLEL